MGLSPFNWDDLSATEQADILGYNNVREKEEAEQMQALGNIRSLM